MKFKADQASAKEMDLQDPIAGFREKFVVSDPDLIYLDGNSLGRLPESTLPHLEHAAKHQWGDQLIRSWNQGWFRKPQALGARLAELIGAEEDEVLICDTTCINLFKLTIAALRSKPNRKKIVSDELNFPSDLYVFQGAADLLGDDRSLEVIQSTDSIKINYSDLKQAVGVDTALLALTHVAFKSAFMYDMEKTTRIAHQAGALMLWDLSHSVGAVPVDLNSCGADLAVGCTYKYLNGGPGSPAFLYVRKELQEELIPAIWGWFGTKDPFEFNLDYETGEGISRFLVSTPHMLSMLALEPALDIMLEAGIDRLREKSITQTEYLIFLFEERLKELGFKLGSPRDAGQRGSHVSLRHPEAYRICKALISPLPDENAPTVIPDFRSPDNIRLGIAPLYTRYQDIYRALERLGQIVQEKIYLKYPEERSAVT